MLSYKYEVSVFHKMSETVKQQLALVKFHTKTQLGEAKPSKICLITSKYATFIWEYTNKTPDQIY